MGDLERGSYPLYYAGQKMLGGASNSGQANLSARTNLDFPSGLGTWQDASAGLVSGKLLLVPVPVEYGDVINFVDVIVGASAASTPTHSWAALYSSAGALVGSQSADGTTAAMALSTRFTFTLAAKYIVNQTDSPYKILYAGVSVTGTAVPSLISGTVPTACQYAWFTNQAAFLAGNIGSALGGTAPTSETLASVTAQSAVPLVFLR